MLGTATVEYNDLENEETRAESFRGVEDVSFAGNPDGIGGTLIISHTEGENTVRTGVAAREITSDNAVELGSITVTYNDLKDDTTRTERFNEVDTLSFAGNPDGPGEAIILRHAHSGANSVRSGVAVQEAA